MIDIYFRKYVESFILDRGCFFLWMWEYLEDSESLDMNVESWVIFIEETLNEIRDGAIGGFLWRLSKLCYKVRFALGYDPRFD